VRIGRAPTSLARIALALALLWSACLAADEPVFTREAVKAEFIWRFPAFVQWPQMPPSQAPFRIGVVADDAVADHLESIVARRKLLGVDASVVRLQSLHPVPNVQVLYVGSAYTGDLRTIAEAIRNRGVLLIADRESALDQGATINFLDLDRRVRFEIAPQTAEANGLKIGPELLAVAAYVRQGRHP